MAAATDGAAAGAAAAGPTGGYSTAPTPATGPAGASTLAPVRPSGEATFSAALTVWKDINLQELQKTLDTQGLEIIENQKENMLGRKKLAEQTRDFKKVSDEEKLGVFKTLLKAYQTEIDSLTRRSKSAENAFLNVYKLLAEAPDPFPLLDAAVDQTARASEARLLEAEVARLNGDNAALKKELAESAVIEKERKKLADKYEKLESRMEDLIAEKVASKEAELNATYDERLRNYEDRERDLNKQVTLVKSQLRDLRTSNESTQAKLLDQGSRQDQEVEARLQEMDLLTADLERSNSRVAEVERRNEKLRAEIESVRSGSESSEKIRLLEEQISELQLEAERLLRSLELQKEDGKQRSEEMRRREEELRRESEGSRAELVGLREKVKGYGDYDEIKRELEIIKYIEFAGSDLDIDLDAGGDTITEFGDDDFTSSANGSSSAHLRLPNPNAEKANRQGGKPLESLLIGKNRKLEDGMTKLRVSQEELTTALHATKSELEEVTSRYEEQRALNDRLENDLLRINGNKSASGSATPKRNYDAGLSVPGDDPNDPLASLGLNRKSMDGPSRPDSSSAPSHPAQPHASTSSSAETSILPIITSQRDRFRQRNSELEEQLLKQSETLTELRGEIKSLQNDNLKMYEKVRYLESYSSGGIAAPAGQLSPGVSSAGGGGSLRTLVGNNKRDEELGKYRNLYEDSMNPFEVFKGREHSRAVGALNPVEKILFGMSSVILGNRYMRNIFVVYAVGLHLFVFLTMYHSATDNPNQYQGLPVPPGGA